MNDAILVFIVLSLAIWLIIKIFSYTQKKDDYNRNGDHYNRDPKGYDKGFAQTNNKEPKVHKPSVFSRLFERKIYLPFDDASVTWCAGFLSIDEKELRVILTNVPACYRQFRISKRSGGYRTISAPLGKLRTVQQTIYHRILLSVNIHPAATGFRQKISIVDNAKPHLGKNNILKTDIKDFFGSIKRPAVIKAFEGIGYPTNISEILAELCCLNKKLPQGAPTSPTLSNIIAYEMDKKLSALSSEYKLCYTRYADDLIFSGDSISQETILPLITNIMREECFVLQRKKTQFLNSNRRKIITGISISSGDKLTIPKKKKRELRQDIHYILTRGLKKHQEHIGSPDPAYLKRIIGYLSFWLSIEPDNAYVIKSLTALKKLQK